MISRPDSLETLGSDHFSSIFSWVTTVWVALYLFFLPSGNSYLLFKIQFKFYIFQEDSENVFYVWTRITCLLQCAFHMVREIVWVPFYLRSWRHLFIFYKTIFLWNKKWLNTESTSSKTVALHAAIWDWILVLDPYQEWCLSTETGMNSEQCWV